MSEKNKNKSSINLSQHTQIKTDPNDRAGKQGHSYTSAPSGQNKRVTAIALSLITCLLICAIGFQVTQHSSDNQDLAFIDRPEKAEQGIRNYSDDNFALVDQLNRYKELAENQAQHISALNQKLEKTIERLNLAKKKPSEQEQPGTL